MKVVRYNPMFDCYPDKNLSGSTFFVIESGSNPGDRYYPETEEELSLLLSRRPASNLNRPLGSMTGPFQKR